jgi:hypothetical protein
MGSKDLGLKKCPKPCWPVRNKEIMTKFTLLTSSSQPSFALTRRIMFLSMENRKGPLKSVKISHHPIDKA